MNNKCVFILSFILLSNVYLSGQEKELTGPWKIISQYNESLSWAESVSAQIDTKISLEGYSNKPSYLESKFTFNRDGDRTEWLEKVLVFDDKNEIDLSSSFESKVIMVEPRSLDVKNSINAKPDIAKMTENYSGRQKKKLDSPQYGNALVGRIFGNSHKSIYELLKGSQNLSISQTPSKINDVLCEVLSAKTKYGTITAWIAPEKGYIAMKWKIEKGHNDFFNEYKLIEQNLETWVAEYKLSELQQVQNIFLPKHSKFTLTIHNKNGNTKISHYDYTVNDIHINPDFKALGAFKIDLPNGTKVFISELPGIRYVWKNGKVVTDVDQSFLDVLDNQIEQLKSDVKAEHTRATEKKTEVLCEESTPIADTEPETQTNITEAQREVISESRPPSLLVLVLIGLLSIGVIGWVVFHRLKAYRRSKDVEL